jgi:hypothetical protein
MLVTFVGGDDGPWHIERNEPVRGEGLSSAHRLSVFEGIAPPDDSGRWALRGATSHERYVTAVEQAELGRRSPPLGRAGSTRAALIPIRKSDAWWRLPQDQRREIFEDRSHHIATGLRSLPAIARRLHHCRDLDEPFDFLTWFEFSPSDSQGFEQLVATLRDTQEWSYVEREVDLRLVRSD